MSALYRAARAKPMSDRKSDLINFVPKMQKDGTWVVLAHCPGQQRPTLLNGFKTKGDALTWIDGPRSTEWKRVWGALHD